MAEPPAVALDTVSKRYGEVEALRGVSFELPRGRAVGYLGPNGAGKSTTLKLLAGLTRPGKGSVRVNGFDPVQDRRKALASVGVLVETPGVLPYVRGEDLLTHIAEVKGISAGERRTAVERAAGTLGVKETLSRPLGGLSTGLLRRMLLAGAMVGDPQVLILDEPTLGLDPAARADLRSTLRELTHGGRTIFLSTHLLDDVAEVCERVLFLREGQLVGDEPVEVGEEKGSALRSRVLKVTSSTDLSAETVGRLLVPPVQSELRNPREIWITFEGDESTQSELVHRLVTGGIQVSRAELVGSDLSARYMAKVGREVAT